MMHTTEIGNTVFNHNGDFSGNVTIHQLNESHREVEATVPMTSLEQLVAQKQYGEMIGWLEGLDLSQEADRNKVARIFYNVRTIMRAY